MPPCGVYFTAFDKRLRSSAVHDVLEIVGHGLVLVDRLLKLAVERGQFLIERLELLLRGLQFFVGGLVLLTRRHRFLVDRPQFLFGNLAVVDGVFEILACGIEVLLELGEPRGVGRRLNGCSLPLWRVLEAEQDQPLAFTFHWPSADSHGDAAAVALHPAGDGDRFFGIVLQLLERRPYRRAQPLARRL
jgi:hypothetical protein